MKPTVSVVISAYNEGKKLDRCLASVSWAHEIIVVDNESTDDTAQIAAKYTKKIYSRPNDLMLNKNKNFGFGKATGTWILNLDADEVVTPELASEIRMTVEKYETDTSVNGFWIARKNVIFGKWINHGFWWPDRQLRLFRCGKGKFPCRYIHEYVKVEGASTELTQPYLHFNYETISQYMMKLDRCTTSEAAEYALDGYTFVWTDAIRFPTRDFVKVYLAQGAYKDGLHGLALSILQACYSFVTFTKLWEMKSFPKVSVSRSDTKKEYARAARELKYWQLSTRIAEEKNPVTRFVLKLFRRLL